MSEKVKSKENWQCGGWEGHENEQLRDGMALSLADKLRWLEEAEHIAKRLSLHTRRKDRKQTAVAEDRPKYGNGY